MDRYPLRPKNEKEAKGRVLFDTALKWCNEAFFDGFIAANMETPEEYEAITTESRIAFMLAAVAACRMIHREPPPDDFLSLFSGGGVHRVTLILYRPLQRIVAGERGLYKCMA